MSSMPFVNWPTFVACLFLLMIAQLLLTAGMFYYVFQIAKAQAAQYRIIRSRILTE